VSLICDAIRTRCLLEFDYHGLHRMVAPYCHGVSTQGHEVLRGVQLRGATSSGRRGLGFGKLWLVADIVGLHLSTTRFEPDDPRYNPDDRAMRQIHCRI
jgi:hypothetical protein